jgi:hypothetical protein
MAGNDRSTEGMERSSLPQRGNGPAPKANERLSPGLHVESDGAGVAGLHGAIPAVTPRGCYDICYDMDE